MTEHEHEWVVSPYEGFAQCDCGAWLAYKHIEQILNDSTVKTIINMVIARRNDEEGV